jgi:UDP-N-acetylmuramyl pentapeptide synthase
VACAPEVASSHAAHCAAEEDVHRRSWPAAAPGNPPAIMSRVLVPARDMAAAFRALMSLQSTGSKLLEAAKTRELVLQAMGHYMDRMGFRLSSLPPVLHIAGTKGKGSTAAMTEAILRSAGLKTGVWLRASCGKERGLASAI